MSRFTLILSTVLLALPVAMASAAEPDDPYDVGSHTGSAASQPVGGNAAVPVLDRTGVSDGYPALPGEPVWKSLERMSSQERGNALIELEPDPGTDPGLVQVADRIEELWNGSKFDEALALCAELESSNGAAGLALGISWRVPASAAEASLWGSDIRIGNRDSIVMTAFDIHRASGNLFTVLLNKEGANFYWSMNFSSNGGLTWSETYAWGEPWQINWVTGAVVGSYFYVAFSSGSLQADARVYRFDVSTGIRANFPDGDPYETVFSAGVGKNIQELVLVTNQDIESTFYFRLYLLAIISDGQLRFFWDDYDNADSWLEAATGVSDAERGLDVCLNENYTNRWLFASYMDTQDSLCIDAYQSVGGYSRLKAFYVGASPDCSAIGAWGDTVTCFFEYNLSYFYTRYEVSYNGGDTWLWGFADDTTAISESPALTAREGGGVAVIYRYYTTPREGRFMWRDYYGSWPARQPYADNQPYWNQPSIEYLGGGRYGIVYLSWNLPYVRAAYFDRGFGGCCKGNRGNANGDALDKTNVSDVTFLLSYLFGIPAGPPPVCIPEANTNGDVNEKVNVSDATYLLSYLFGMPSGPPPPACP